VKRDGAGPAAMMLVITDQEAHAEASEYLALEFIPYEGHPALRPENIMTPYSTGLTIRQSIGVPNVPLRHTRKERLSKPKQNMKNEIKILKKRHLNVPVPFLD